MMKEMLRELIKQGVAVEEALPRFIDDSVYYLNTLYLFIEECEIDMVEQCAANGKISEAINHAYNVKAMTGTLGLTESYENAQQLCEYLKEEKKEKIEKSIAEIKRNLDKIYALL